MAVSLVSLFAAVANPQIRHKAKVKWSVSMVIVGGHSLPTGGRVGMHGYLNGPPFHILFSACSIKCF